MVSTEMRLKGLIYHELGHIWHECKGIARFHGEYLKEKAILQLYREGIAMVCEQILCKDECYYHQGEEWAEWCKNNLIEIKKEYWKRIENGKSVQDFFGDWNDYKGYPDTGYYLGAQFIRYLMCKYPFNRIASLPYQRLYDEYRIWSVLDDEAERNK